MQSVREASIEWLSLTIQKERPETQQPAELAAKLLEVAERYAIPVEDVRNWIQEQKPYEHITAHRLTYWARSYDATRAMQRRRQKSE